MRLVFYLLTVVILEVFAVVATLRISIVNELTAKIFYTIATILIIVGVTYVFKDSDDRSRKH